MNRRLVDKADALVFHGWPEDLKWYDLPRQRRDQPWVFMTQESPYLSPNLDSFYDKFNWAMTYRRDSDIFHPYGGFEPLPEDLGNQEGIINEIISNKTKLVVGVASKCKTFSEREKLVERLKFNLELMNSSLEYFGLCGTPIESKGNDGLFWKELGLKYRFYLAFENAICEDYLTEKFWRSLELGIVPVVYGGADYKAVAPPNSFINVGDFKNSKELAKYLIKLGGNKGRDEYKKYFEWRKRFRVIGGGRYCSLCRKVEAMKRNTIGGKEGNQRLKIIENLKSWWKNKKGQLSACFPPHLPV